MAFIAYRKEGFIYSDRNSNKMGYIFINFRRVFAGLVLDPFSGQAF